ncbi:MAG: kelch repeat-containing protein [archaeon]|nr:kelch repeat-containing protein [archaeon]
MLTKGLSQTGAHLIGAKIYLLNENLDIYVFDTRTLYWSKPATFGVQPLPCVSFASALVGEKLYVFGGLRGDGQVSNDLYIFDTVHSAWAIEKEAKSEKSDQVAHQSSVSSPTWLPAVSSSSSSSSSSSFSSSSSLKQLKPSPRRGHTATVVGAKIYYFGGVTTESLVLDELWSFDTETHAWAREAALCGQPPSPRTYHAAVTAGKHIYVYGGTDGECVFGDLFRFEPPTNTWQQIFIPLPPSKRPGVFGHSLTLIGQWLLIFGGHDDQQHSSDLEIICLETGNWQPVPVTGSTPSPRAHHQSIFLDNRLLIFGGANADTCYADVNQLDLSCYSWLPIIKS